MKSINNFGLGLFSGSGFAQTSNVGADSTTAIYISPMQMANWADFRLTALNNTSYDGEVVQFQDINNPNLKTNLAFPTEIKVSY